MAFVPKRDDGSYPRRMDGCHRRLSLHRATPPPAAVAFFPHCCRPPLSLPLAAAAPAARPPLAAAASAARPPLAAAVAAPGCHRRRHQPPAGGPPPAAACSWRGGWAFFTKGRACAVFVTRQNMLGPAVLLCLVTLTSIGQPLLRHVKRYPARLPTHASLW